MYADYQHSDIEVCFQVLGSATVYVVYSTTLV